MSTVLQPPIQRYPNMLFMMVERSPYNASEIMRRTDIPRTTFYRYLHGEAPIQEDHLNHLAAFFVCSAEDIFPTNVSLSDVLQSPGNPYYLWVLAGRETMNEIRRLLLQGIPIAGATLLLYPQKLLNADTVARVSHALQSTSPPGDETLAALESITENSWTMYRTTMAKIDLFGSVVGQLKTLTQMLQRPQTEATKRRLLEMISNTAQVAGEVAFDVQACELAQEYYQLAIDSAKRAGDSALQAVSLGRMGFVPVYRHQFKTALPVLEEASRCAIHSASPTVQSWIGMMEAEAFANLGNDDLCYRAIGRAEDALAKAVPGEDSKGTGFNSLTLLAYKGTCYLRLYQQTDAQKGLSEKVRRTFAEEAQQCFEQSLLAFPLQVRRRGIILGDLATSLVYQGEVEEAARLGMDSLALADLTKSARGIQRLEELQHTLEPWQKVSSVKAFNQQFRVLKEARLAG